MMPGPEEASGALRAALPASIPIPPEVAARVRAAIATQTPGVTPIRTGRRLPRMPRWLPAAAAAALGLGLVGVVSLGHDGGQEATSQPQVGISAASSPTALADRAAAAAPEMAAGASGSEGDLDVAGLVSAVQDLVATGATASPVATAEPGCLAEINRDHQPGPLLVHPVTFRGIPALVVVFSEGAQLRIIVVSRGCTAGAPGILANLNAPAPQ